MVRDLKGVRALAVGIVFALLIGVCACVNYVPREEETSTVTEQTTAPEHPQTQPPSPPQTDTEAATDADGFENLPEDDQTKRY